MLALAGDRCVESQNDQLDLWHTAEPFEERLAFPSVLLDVQLKAKGRLGRSLDGYLLLA